MNWIYPKEKMTAVENFDMAGIDFIVDMSRLVISEIEIALAPKLVEEV